MSTPAKEHQGAVRPVITYNGRKMSPVVSTDYMLFESLGIEYNGQKEVEKDHFTIKWVQGDMVDKVVWTENILCLPGVSFVPQIVGTGKFKPTGAMYVDKENKRHRVLPCDVGAIGAQFRQPISVRAVEEQKVPHDDLKRLPHKQE